MTTYPYQLLMVLCTAVGSLFLLHSVYFFVIAVVGLKSQKQPPATEARTRFAVLVAACNEAAVVGMLVDSLKAQNYPATLYDVMVAPNNCTDDTRAVTLAHGAQIFEPTGPISGKGDVLRQMCQKLLEEDRYDAICVFDADNLVHPDFLQRMNDAYTSGMQAVQGYRDSKNPADSAVSTCSSIHYWIVNRFYNGGRENLGLSSLIHGCGFMVSLEMLRRLNGWDTQAITEDYEFTVQCVLAGERVRYLSSAVFYDEQPLTIRQSWRQRMRWGVGYVQVSKRYWHFLLRRALLKRDRVSLDMLLTVIFPVTQPFGLLPGAVFTGLVSYGVVNLHTMPLAMALLSVIAGLFAIFMACTLFAAFVILLCRGNLCGTGRGIAAYALFQLPWLPISIISLFKKDVRWEATGHTRGMSLEEVGRKP